MVNVKDAISQQYVLMIDENGYPINLDLGNEESEIIVDENYEKLSLEKAKEEFADYFGTIEEELLTEDTENFYVYNVVKIDGEDCDCTIIAPDNWQ